MKGLTIMTEKEMQENFLKIQNSYISKIDCSDSLTADSINTVAGVDLAYWNENGSEYAVCCIVLIDFHTHEVIERKHFNGRIEVPYMPGFLSFRELPLIMETVKFLVNKPDIYMFDGNGYLHPRHMGIATYASFFLNTPTIGVAKTYFRADKKTDYTEPDSQSGSFTDIVIDGEVYGRVLRTHSGVKPVFVSVGNYISLDTACKITMSMMGKESHIPIPTRTADLDTHEERRKILGTN